MPQSGPAESLPFDRVVVPVQGTDREFDVQRWAVEFAAATGAPVAAVHVSPDPDAVPADVFQFLEKFCDDRDVELETHVLAGTEEGVVEVLLSELDALDLVIIGTAKLGHGYHVGSVAEGLIQGAPGPVQVLRIE